MSELYNRIEELCKGNRTNITEMCRLSGAARGSLTDLKMGRTNALSSETLSKIAAFFRVSVDYILTGTEKAPTETGERTEADLKAAFFGGYSDDLSEEDVDELWNDAKEYMKFKLAQKKNKKE